MATSLAPTRSHQAESTVLHTGTYIFHTLMSLVNENLAIIIKVIDKQKLKINIISFSSDVFSPKNSVCPSRRFDLGTSLQNGFFFFCCPTIKLISVQTTVNKHRYICTIDIYTAGYVAATSDGIYRAANAINLTDESKLVLV